MKKIIKVITIIPLCFIIIFTPIVNDYNSICYADDSWLDIVNSAYETDRKILVAAVKAGLNIFGYKETFSYAVDKAIFTWTYNQWDKACRNAGISGGINAFNQTAKYRFSNSKLQFFFNVTGLADLNALYQYLCQHFDIDTGYHKTIYSGGYFEDDDGNGCYVYVAQNTVNSSYSISDSNISDFAAVGTSLKYDNTDLLRLVPNTGDEAYVSFNINQHTYSDSAVNSWAYVNNIIPSRGPAQGLNVVTSYGRYWIYSTQPFGQSPLSNVYGEYTVIHFTKNDKYALGIMTHNMAWEVVNSNLYQFRGTYIDLSPHQQNVNAYNDDKTKPDLDKDATVDTNKDSVDGFLEDNNPDVTYDQEEPPSQQPVDPNAVTPNNDNPTINPGNSDFNFQMPNINIQWNLPFNVNNMPFPFSIPFDIKNFLEILDSEPIAPSYEFDFYILDNHVEYEIDLSEFDEAMEIIRNIELAGYCIFLIISTRALFHIY